MKAKGLTRPGKTDIIKAAKKALSTDGQPGLSYKDVAATIGLGGRLFLFVVRNCPCESKSQIGYIDQKR